MDTTETKITPDMGFRIGTALWLERHKQGKTQQEIADAAQMDRAALSMLESGKRINSIGKLYRVADALGIPLWMIFKECEELGDREEILSKIRTKLRVR